MNKFAVVIVIAAYFFGSPAWAAEVGASPKARPSTAASAEQPAYAEWGRFALNEVKSRYAADVVDYLHVGRTPISPQVTEETFKFWLRDRSRRREFGVIVRIRFNPETKEVLDIRFTETDR
jgi:hypothetical protein